MFTQKFIKIFHSVQEIRPFSLFQNLALGKASTDDKCHFPIVFFQNLNLGKNSTNLKCHLTISWGTSCQYQCVCKILLQYSTQFRRDRHYHFSEFGARQSLDRTSTDEKWHFAISWARPCQYQCVCKILSKYSKQFKNLISLFSEFELRQNLDQSQISFGYLMGYFRSISMYMQNFITIFHSVQEIGPFSLFQKLELG